VAGRDEGAEGVQRDAQKTGLARGHAFDEIEKDVSVHPKTTENMGLRELHGITLGAWKNVVEIIHKPLELIGTQKHGALPLAGVPMKASVITNSNLGIAEKKIKEGQLRIVSQYNVRIK